MEEHMFPDRGPALQEGCRGHQAPATTMGKTRPAWECLKSLVEETPEVGEGNRDLAESKVLPLVPDGLNQASAPRFPPLSPQ